MALGHGIAMMHQELQIVPFLTVAQNVFLGFEDANFGILKSNEPRRLHKLMAETGFALDPHTLTRDLPIADQQKVEILRALARNAKLIVMDEPTSSLSKDEIVQLHDIMEKLRENGTSVIYVSHFLDDIMQVSDRIAVLRDGNHTVTLQTAQTAKPDLVSAILGSGQTETRYPPRVLPELRQKILNVRNLSSPNGTKNVTLEVCAGEIVGLIGLVGSGRTEIGRAIVGADPASAGEVTFMSAAYADRSPEKSTRSGLVMVPEDRRGQGLVMAMSVRANVSLPHLSAYATAGIVNADKERRKTRELIDYFDVRPAIIDGDVSTYSGGNQQKVLIGKWLAEKPNMVILDEPSRGVDIGAREKIHDSIAELAASGTGILLISSEIEEVLGLSHRAYLVDRGRIMAGINCAKSNESDVLATLFALQEENGRQGSLR